MRETSAARWAWSPAASAASAPRSRPNCAATVRPLSPSTGTHIPRRRRPHRRLPPPRPAGRPLGTSATSRRCPASVARSATSSGGWTSWSRTPGSRTGARCRTVILSGGAMSSTPTSWAWRRRSGPPCRSLSGRAGGTSSSPRRYPGARPTWASRSISPPNGLWSGSAGPCGRKPGQRACHRVTCRDARRRRPSSTSSACGPPARSARCRCRSSTGGP